MNKTNEQYLRAALKEVENVSPMASALLRERLFAYCKNDLKLIEQNKAKYRNPLVDYTWYVKTLTTFGNALGFDEKLEFNDNLPQLTDEQN